MADTAELVAWHEMLAGPIKACGQGGDVAWNEHSVYVGALDKEAVDCVGACRAENDRRVRRHDDALRREGVLLADDAHRHRTIRLGRTAEIALDELAINMQRGRIDGLRLILRHGRTPNAPNRSQDHNEGKDCNGKRRPTTFGVRCNSAAVVMGIRRRGSRVGHAGTPRGTNTKK